MNCDGVILATRGLRDDENRTPGFRIKTRGPSLRGPPATMRLRGICQRQPFADGGMIIKEPGDQRVRIGVGLVNTGELDESRPIRRAIAGPRQSIAVALGLEEPANLV